MKKQILIAAVMLCALAGSKQTNAQWGLTGNAATNPATNFIGTTDAKSFNVRTNNANRITIASDGKVGVGTTTPAQALDVQSAGTTNVNVKSTSSNANILIDRFNSASNASVSYRTNGSPTWQTGTLGNDNFSIRNITTGSNPITIMASNSNVGIGTTTPGYKLEVAGDAMFNGVRVGRGNGGLQSNTVVGAEAMIYNSTGNNNTAIGFGTLNSNSTGNSNTAVGSYALNFNYIGVSNTAVGVSALQSNNSNYNTAFGYQTQYANNTGENNAAFGSQALTTNSSGNYNSAFGTNALFYNTASNNSAFGNYAMFANNSGNNNTASGYYAMLGNTSGSGNCAYGANSMVANTIGYANTAVGNYSLYSNIDGNSNTAFGSQSLQNNVWGYFNTAMGQASLAANLSFDNTAVGRFALLTSQTGSSNTALGSAANTNDSSLSNVTLLGFYTVGTASNSVQIGNNSVTSVKAANGVVIVSDGRFKKNVKSNVPGLDFINALKPVTYNYDVHGLDKFEGVGENNTKEKMISDVASKQYEDAVNKKEKIVYSGFIAQEVEKAAQNLGYDFSGVYKPQNARDAYGLNYAEFTVPLVKAVQELNAQNKELILKNELLENRLNDMQQCLEKLCADNATQKESYLAQHVAGTLKQNQPNPFNQISVIEYQLDNEINSAQIVIRNLNGELMKTITINQAGSGQITINANEFTQGTYTYTLIVNNKNIDTKLMVVTK